MLVVKSISTIHDVTASYCWVAIYKNSRRKKQKKQNNLKTDGKIPTCFSLLLQRPPKMFSDLILFKPVVKVLARLRYL